MAKRTRKIKEAPRATTPTMLSVPVSYEQVAHKAYELYQQRGAEHGRDLEDWFRAEQLVHEALRAAPFAEDHRGGRSQTGIRV
jgi:DUF2934 family protein